MKNEVANYPEIQLVLQEAGHALSTPASGRKRRSASTSGENGFSGWLILTGERRGDRVKGGRLKAEGENKTVSNNQ